MHRTDSPTNRQAELLELHNRLLGGDPVVTEEIFAATVPELEKHLRLRFPNIFGVDPDIYTLAVYEALTDYFKNPEKYDPEKSGLMTYLRMASRGDLQNLLRKETRHAKVRTSLESVEFNLFDGNDVSETVAEDLDIQRLIADLKQGMTSEEQAVFDLMIEGERSTQAAAEAMNIEHLPVEEQNKRVKRTKDRIKKRIQRRGELRS